jgi:hypothetical protein
MFILFVLLTAGRRAAVFPPVFGFCSLAADELIECPTTHIITSPYIVCNRRSNDTRLF